jgi:hypothetical protein
MLATGVVCSVVLGVGVGVDGVVMGVQGCGLWVLVCRTSGRRLRYGGILVLPGFTEFDRVGFSDNAGLGNPAYNVGFDSRFHVLVFAEPRPGPNLDLALLALG